MKVDFLLPISLFLIVVLSILSHKRVENKIRMILEDKKIGIREIILMVMSMGIMVTIIAFIPTYAIQILFIAFYSYLLLVFTYVILGKLFLAITSSAFFIIAYLVSYFIVDNILIVNIFMSVFSAIFAVMIITYLNSLFSLKITLIFAALLTVMDVIQVFWTGHMVEAATKMILLHIPVALVLPTYPSIGFSVLGLGDIFLSGLLSTQVASKYSRKTGFLTAATISIAFFIFEIFMLNTGTGARGFPATIVVLMGWLMGMGIHALQKRLLEKNRY
ncbi:MAG: hypothetical protein QXR45_00200 [Candidatus Bathyarchaeia archaeon]